MTKGEEFVKLISQLKEQLKSTSKTLNDLSYLVGDNDGNYGQYSDLKKTIDDFLVDELLIVDL